MDYNFKYMSLFSALLSLMSQAQLLNVTTSLATLQVSIKTTELYLSYA